MWVSIVLATGAEPYQATEFGYGVVPQVITVSTWRNASTKSRTAKVTIVACVVPETSNVDVHVSAADNARSGDEDARSWKQSQNPIQDIRAFTRFGEEAYEEAARKGVQFFKYNEELPPEEAVTYKDGQVKLHDELSDSSNHPHRSARAQRRCFTHPENGVAQQLRVVPRLGGLPTREPPQVRPS